MSEKQSRGIGDLSKYDAMTTEELEEILRLDAEAPEEQESDIEKILYIMEVLAERKRNNGHPGKPHSKHTNHSKRTICLNPINPINLAREPERVLTDSPAGSAT